MCTHVYDKLSCTRLQNYTIVYTNIVAVTKFIAKNKKNNYISQSNSVTFLWLL